MKRTAQQQMKALDFRLGAGVGAVRERKRLKAIIKVEEEKAREEAKQAEKQKGGKKKGKKK